MKNQNNTSKIRDFAGTRQSALLRVIDSQNSANSHIEGLETRVQSDNPLLNCLGYAMAFLGDSRPLLHAEGELTDVLEANSITFREVRTPGDLTSGTRALLLVLAASDGRPLVVHRQAGKVVVFDPLHSPPIQTLTP